MNKKWWFNAKCITAKTSWFFLEDHDTITELREDYCFKCPVRTNCFADVMQWEEPIQDGNRFGLVAGLTPQQRVAIQHRGIQQCECGTTFDPIQYIGGVLFCYACDREFPIRPVPDDGAAWHTKYSKVSDALITWITDNVAPGSQLPPTTKLAKALRTRRTDVVHILNALVADGSIKTAGNKHFRTHNALVRWTLPKKEAA